MPKPKVILEGNLSTKSVAGGYRFRTRKVVPFIGAIVREDGTVERGIGAKCPTQEFLFFQPMKSDDPFHYWRGLQILQYVWEIDDDIVKDAITAGTGADVYLTKAVKRNEYNNNWLRHFEEAVSQALTQNPNVEMLERIMSGFALHGVPLARKEPLVSMIDDTAPSCSVIHLAQQDMSDTVKERPCYLLLHTIDSPVHTTTSSAT